MRKLKLTAISLLLACAVHAQRDHRLGNWTPLPGKEAKDISINNNGVIYMVTTTGILSEYTGSGWNEYPEHKLLTFGEFSNRAVKVLANGNMLRKVTRGDAVSWEPMPGSAAQDIAVTHYGQLPGAMKPGSDFFLVNNVGKLYGFNARVDSWYQLPGSDGARISAGNEEVWLVNTVGKIYKYRHPNKRNNMKDGWDQMPGANGRDIAISHDGTKWLVTTDGKLHKWLNNGWSEISGVRNAHRVSANNGKVVIISTSGKMYMNTY